MSTILNVFEVETMSTAEKIGQHLRELHAEGVSPDIAQYLARDMANRLYADGITIYVQSGDAAEDAVDRAQRRLTRAIQTAARHQRADAEEVSAAQEALADARRAATEADA